MEITLVIKNSLKLSTRLEIMNLVVVSSEWLATAVLNLYKVRIWMTFGLKFNVWLLFEENLADGEGGGQIGVAGSLNKSPFLCI